MSCSQESVPEVVDMLAEIAIVSWKEWNRMFIRNCTHLRIAFLLSLMFVYLCFLGCGDDDDDDDEGPPQWQDPAVKAEVDGEEKTAICPTEEVKLSAWAEDPDGDLVNYQWTVLDITEIPPGSTTMGEEVQEDYLSLPSGSPTTFRKQEGFSSIEPGIYFVEVDASDGPEKSGIVAKLPQILVSGTRYASAPAPGQQVPEEIVIRGDMDCSDSAPGSLGRRAPSLLAADPVISGRFTLHILVVGDKEDSGTLSEAINVNADGSWEKQTAIGEPDDHGLSFTIYLVFIDQSRLDELEIEGIDAPIMPRTSIELSVIEDLREDELGRQVFDDTFQRIEVIRELEGKDLVPPEMIGGSVRDGGSADPDLLNSEGVEIIFSEEITGNAQLFGFGEDLNWESRVIGNRLILERRNIGEELAHETEYEIKGNVKDAAGNETQFQLSFTTEPFQ